MAWTTANLSQARYELAGAAAAGKVVFAGGQNLNGVVFNTVDIYDVATGTWSTDTLSQARYGLAATACGNKIYFAGGFDMANQVSKVIDIYDAAANTWSVDSLSQARGYLSAASMSGLVIFAGGSDNALASVFSTVDILDTTTATWNTDTLAIARCMGAATALGNKFIIAGGLEVTLFPTNTAEIYTVSSTGINQINTNENVMSVSPNPAHDEVVVSLSHTGDFRIEVTDMVGKVVYSDRKNIQSGSYRFAVNDFPKGMYFVNVTDGVKNFAQKLLID